MAARVGNKKWFGTLELEDSRAHLEDEDTPLGTDDVNAIELVQALVGVRIPDALHAGDQLEILAGRMTIDLGSQRLINREVFRNTLNSFDGVHVAWHRYVPGGAAGGTGDKEGVGVRAFYLLPVDRLPSERALLDHNRAKLDRDNSHAHLWGIHVSHPRLASGFGGELYVLGLREEDRPDAPTRNRDLITSGARLLRPPAPGHWDFEVETARQDGHSRRTASPADTTDLDHEAWFAHLHVGRKLAGPSALRLAFQYDYVSGDEDPTDGRNGHFDTLWGSNRFEFGPTGIYGLLSRSNLSSPGLKLDLTPKPGWSVMVAYRAAWLASSRDVMTTTGLQDPDGTSGSFIGHTIEGRLRLSLRPGNIGLELGAAHLFAGRFLTEGSLTDTTYGYVQTTFTF